ncbi:MAG: hypothetical protein OXC59_05560, partial [Acidimicrobiaceae bacterium]|nr:hypothetical protein [Acidimicrobiaceae bacterium]
GSESLVLELGGLPSGYTAGEPSSVVVVIADNDRAGINLGLVSFAVSEKNDSSSFSMHLSSEPTADVTVTITSSVPSAIVVDGSDQDSVGSASETLVFTPDAWETLQEFVLIGVDDDIVNPGGRRTSMISVTWSSTDSIFNSAFAPFTMTVNDDDTAGVTIDESSGDTSVAEDGSATDSYTVVLDSEPTADVTVTVTSATPSAAVVDGSDNNSVGSASETLTFTASTWDDPQTITVTGVDNDVDDTGDERIVTISHTTESDDADYDEISDVDDVKVTVNDDDAAPSAIKLSVDADTAADGVQGSVAEGGGTKTAQVTATISGTTRFAASQDVTVRVGASADTATEVTDYAAVADQTVTIPAGMASGTATFALAPVDDALDEPSESLSVTAAPLQGVTFTGTTVTITDDDATTVTLARTDRGAIVEDASASAAAREAEFTVTLGRTLVAGERVDVPLSLSGAGITIGDFVVALKTGAGLNTGVTLTGTTTLAPTVQLAGAAARTATLVLTAVDDSTDEDASETVTVELGNLAGASLGTNTAGGAAPYDDNNPNTTENTFDVAITDDDTAAPTDVVVTLAVSNSGAVDEGDTLTVTVTLGSAAPAGGVTVPVRMRTSGSPTASADDFTLAATVTVAQDDTTGTATFTAVDDDLDEDSESLVLELHTLPSGYTTGTPSAAAVTIADDDTAGVTITESSGDTTVAESSGSDTYTVELDSQPTHDVTVTVTSGTPSAALVDGSDNNSVGSASETLTFTPSGATAWNVTQTVTVTGVDNDIVDTDNQRIVTISHTTESTDTQYDEISDVDSVTVTVTDDETTPTIALSVSPTSVEEGDGATVIAVTATVSGTVRFDEARTLTVSVAGSSAATAVDFMPVQDFDITIAAGAATGTGSFTLTPIVDADDETDETITVSAVVSGAPTLTVTAATVALTDDDEPVVSVSVAAASVTEGAAAVFTVSADPAPAADLSVSLAVSEDSAGNHVAADDEGAGTVVIRAGQTSASLSVGTVDDSVDEPNGLVSVVLADGSGYSLGAVSSVSVRVHDDDDDGSVRGVVVERSDGSAFGAPVLKKGESVSFRVRLVSGTGPVTVSLAVDERVNLVHGTDFAVPLSVVIPAGESEVAAVLRSLDSDWLGSQLVALVPSVPEGFSVSPGRLDFILKTSTVAVDLRPAAGSSVSDSVDVVVLERSSQEAGLSLQLLRVLKAGERVDVPLVLSGSGVTAADFSLSLATGDGLNTGVVLESPGSLSPTVVFSGVGAQFARLVLRAAADGEVEDFEVVSVSLGDRAAFAADTDTNVEGGAAPNLRQVPVKVGIVSDEDTPVVSLSVLQYHVAVGSPLRYGVAVSPAQPYPLAVGLSVNSDSGGVGYLTEVTDRGDVTREVPAGSGSVVFSAATSRPPGWWAPDRVTVSLRRVGGYVFGAPSVVSAVLSLPGVTTAEASGLTVTEDGSDTASFTVVLDAPVSCPVSLPEECVGVTVASSDRSAVEVSLSASGPFANRTQAVFGDDDWDTAQRVYVRGVDDDTVNIGGARAVSLSFEVVAFDPLYGGVTEAPLSVSVTDDDAGSPAVFAVVPGDLAVAENVDGSTTAIVVGSPVTAADADGDSVVYALAAPVYPGFSIDAASGQISYSGTGLDRERLGGSVGLVVTAVSPGRGGVSTVVRRPVTVTVTDADEGDAELSVSGFAYAGRGVMRFAALGGDPDGDPNSRDADAAGLVLLWQTSADDGGSWQTATGTGAATASYSVAAADAGRLLRLRASYTDGGGNTETVFSAPVTVTGVTWVEALVKVSDATATEGEAADVAVMSVGVGLPLLAGETVTVPLSFAGGAAGTDFTLSLSSGSPSGVAVSAAGVLTFTGPVTGPAFVRLAAVSDADTVSERLTVSVGDMTAAGAALADARLSGTVVGSAAVWLTEPHSGRIVNLSVAPAAVSEGGSATVTVSLSGSPLNTALSVPLTVTGTGVTASDYRLSTSTVTVPVGATSATAVIAAASDAVTEDRESWTIGFGVLPAGLTAGDVAVLRVFDAAVSGQGSVRVAVNGAVLRVAEGATATYEVSLASAPTADVTLTAASSNSAVVSVSAALTFTTQTWQTPQTFTVRAADDAADLAGLAPRRATITHTAASTDESFDGVVVASVDVTVIDDDATEVTLARSGVGGPVTEAPRASDRAAEFTVQLSRALTAGERIDAPLVLSGTGVTASDVSLTLKSAAGVNTGVVLRGRETLTPTVVLSGAGARTATLVVTAVDDAVAEGAGETLRVALGDLAARGLGTNVGGGAAPSDDGDSGTVDNTFEVLIADDDEPVSVTLARSDSGAILEAGATDAERQALFDVSLSRALFGGEQVAVPLSFTGAGITAADFLLSLDASGGRSRGVRLVLRGGVLNATLHFTGAGARTARVVVTATADSLDEAATETLTAALGDAASFSAVGADGATNVVGGAAASSTQNSASAAITDAETALQITLAASDATLAEADSSDTATVTVTLSRALAAGQSLSVPITYTGGRSGEDFTVAPASAVTGVRLVSAPAAAVVVFTGPSAAAVTLQFTAAADVDTDSEQVVLTIPAASDSRWRSEGLEDTLSVANPRMLTLTVTDDEATPAEPLTVTLTATDTTLSEGDSSAAARLRVALSAPLQDGESVTVPLVFTAGTVGDDIALALQAVGARSVLNEGLDSETSTVVLSGSSLTFTGPSSSAADYSADVTVTALQDDDIIDERVTVTTGQVTHTGLPDTPQAAGRVTLAVTDDDEPLGDPDDPDAVAVTVTVGFSGRPAAERAVEILETGGSSEIEIALNAPGRPGGLFTGERVEVPLRIAGTAAAGTDYTLALKTGTGINTGVTELATAPLTGANPVLVFARGATVAVLVLTATPDAVAEGDAPSLFAETARITLGDAAAFDRAGSTVKAAAAAARSVTVDIVDDDQTAAVAVSPVSLRIVEGDSDGAAYRIRLTTAPTATTTVTATAASGLRVNTEGASPSATAQAVFTASDWWRTKPVTVTASDNNTDDTTRSLAVTHTVTGYGTVTTAARVDVAVTDDDPTTITLTGGGTVTESDTSTSAEVTFTLNRTLTAGETVQVPLSLVSPTAATLVTPRRVRPGQQRVPQAINWTLTGVGATVGIDPFARVSRLTDRVNLVVTLTGAGAQTATLTLTPAPAPDDDNTDDRINITIPATLNNPTRPSNLAGGLTATGAATVTITDQSTLTPGVTITQTDSNTTVAEDGSVTDSYTVVLDSRPAANVTVTVTSGTPSAALVDGPDTPDPDDPTAIETLTFTALTWNVSQTVTVTGVDNSLDDPGDERVV